MKIRLLIVLNILVFLFLLVGLFFLLFSFTVYKGQIQRINDRLSNTNYHLYGFYNMAKNITHKGILTSIGSDRDYKFQPFFTFLLIPCIIFKINPAFYINILLVLFRVLTIIPLTLFLEKFLSFKYSVAIATLTILYSPLYYEPTVGYYYYTFGTAFGFMFSCLFLSLYENRNVFLTSFLFAFLFIIHPIAILLIPIVFYWFYKNKKPFKDYVKFLILPTILPSIWFIRNGIVHGFTIQGVFGDYWDFKYLNYIQPSLIIPKLQYMISFGTRLTYINWFFLTLLFVLPVLTYFLPKNRLKLLSKTLSLNFLIFLPTIFYYKTIEPTWKYLALMSPFYICLFALCCFKLLKPFLKQIESIQTKYDRKTVFVNGLFFNLFLFFVYFTFLYYFFGFIANVWNWSFSLSISGFLSLVSLVLYYVWHTGGKEK